MGVFLSMGNLPDVITATIGVLTFLGVIIGSVNKILRKMDVSNLHLENMAKGLEKVEQTALEHGGTLGKHSNFIERHEVQLQNHHDRITRLEEKA